MSGGHQESLLDLGLAPRMLRDALSESVYNRRDDQSRRGIARVDQTSQRSTMSRMNRPAARTNGPQRAVRSLHFSRLRDS